MVFCIVPGCNSKSNKRTYRSGIMLHTFPPSIEKIRSWLQQMGPVLGNINILAEKVLTGKRTDIYRMCSDHFTPDCYVIKKKLKVGAMPTIFPKNLVPPSGVPALDTGGDQAHAANAPSASDRAPPAVWKEDASRSLGFHHQIQERGLGMVSPSHEEQSRFLASSRSPEKKQENVTERILKLALEVIYLLTGEVYGPVKKLRGGSSPRLSGGQSRRQKPTVEPPPISLTLERSSEKKILEATSKIIELLTGEVPIRSEDVAVYLSMEEREYLEGHCDRYKATMMEDQPPLPSQDGSRKRNPPERSPRPEVPHRYPQKGHNLFNIVIKEEAEEVDVRSEEPFLEKKVSAGISRDPGDATLTQRNVKAERKIHVKIKEEENLMEIGADGRYRSYDGEVDGDMKPNTSEESPTFPDTSTGLCSADPSTGRCPPNCSEAAAHPSSQKGNKTLPYTCSDCGKSFRSRSNLMVHAQMHVEKKTYSCPKCGKTFLQKCDLVIHDRVHTGNYPFWCSKCGKGFSYKSGLITHERVHTGEKPYSCSECGKSFAQKSILLQHRRIHTEEKPYSCSECGKGFSQKSSLISHERMHTGEKPYSCTVCGKSFHMKSILLQHEKIHTRKKPYSCSECGKGFTQNSDLIKHQEVHVKGNTYPCTQCGECYATQPALAKHQLSHTQETSFSDSQSGDRFLDYSARDRPKRMSHARQTASSDLK